MRTRKHICQVYICKTVPKQKHRCQNPCNFKLG